MFFLQKGLATTNFSAPPCSTALRRTVSGLFPTPVLAHNVEFSEQFLSISSIPFQTDLSTSALEALLLLHSPRPSMPPG
jgi:hypothetical protein